MTTKTISVLIVEDETIVAFDIESILESLGYRVTNSIINVTLRSLIYRLRCKLKPQMIETVTGFGCRLVLK